ncbi:MAG: DUF1697 domain-containing protein [Gemmatimonadota bacterium]|jgi:uncharacterized protein (DUF1697 family)
MSDPAMGPASGRSSPPSGGEFVAFLRAINVGGHTVKMDRLRALFEETGVRDVATFIASGNVIFRAAAAGPALEARIERQLFEALGYEVATFIRPLPRLAQIAAAAPFVNDGVENGGTLYVGFLKHAGKAAAREALEDLRSDTDDFVLKDRELYWLCRTRFSDSPVSGGLLEKRLDTLLTIRNANTLERIVRKFDAER